jgi:tryptophan synthase beta chain
MVYKEPDKRGRYGEFGGKFVPEILMPALEELERAYKKFKKDPEAQKELKRYLTTYAGRPTPLYLAKNISKDLGFKVYLKREDLVHGGAHKLNNTLGQAMLAKRMGKKRLIAETAAGQHGFATAIAGTVLGLETEVFMGAVDIERQKSNVIRIKLVGGKVRPVTSGNQVLKDAVNEAMRDWIANLSSTHYIIGSTVGPHPFPMIVRDFQSVIGKEMKKQIMDEEGRLPDMIIACGSGGSNAIGAFYPFLEEKVKLVFVEGGGTGEAHAAALTHGTPGVLQGAYTYMLQDKYGRVSKTKSRSAGLNYPGRGPEIAYLKSIGRIQGEVASDEDVLKAFEYMSKKEAIIPAFETCHAIAYLMRLKGKLSKDKIAVLNFSGRGDKDLDTAVKLLGMENG